MRRVVDYNSDKVICRIADLPPIALGAIVRIHKVNYTVLDMSTNRRETEIYVEKRTGAFGQHATPDHTLEAV